MSGITSVAGASTASTATKDRPAQVHFRFEFLQRGVVVATIPITNTTAEANAKHNAWEEFAKQKRISVEEAKQQYTLRRKLS